VTIKMLVYIAIIAALICFILYVLDRRMRGEPIDWVTAGKISLVGGLLSGGTGYALSDTPEVAKVVETVATAATPTDVQEMFVGVPTF
jgi:uncharacterized membrane protein YsdA (DUF1294 family)